MPRSGTEAGMLTRLLSTVCCRVLSPAKNSICTPTTTIASRRCIEDDETSPASSTCTRSRMRRVSFTQLGCAAAADGQSAAPLERRADSFSLFCACFAACSLRRRHRVPSVGQRVVPLAAGVWLDAHFPQFRPGQFVQIRRPMPTLCRDNHQRVQIRYQFVFCGRGWDVVALRRWLLALQNVLAFRSPPSHTTTILFTSTNRAAYQARARVQQG